MMFPGIIVFDSTFSPLGASATLCILGARILDIPSYEHKSSILFGKGGAKIK